jgi:hypothetical protein
MFLGSGVKLYRVNNNCDSKYRCLQQILRPLLRRITLIKNIIIGVVASIVTALLLLAGGLIGSKEVNTLIPKNSVIAFSQETCPKGWNDFKPAYGRFVRGIDRNEVTLDPEGERTVNSLQLDSLIEHKHTTTGLKQYPSWSSQEFIGKASDFASAMKPSVGGYAEISLTGDKETRPINVALLYCIKS